VVVGQVGGEGLGDSEGIRGADGKGEAE